MEDIINLFGEIKRNIEDYQIFKEKKIVGDFLLKKYYKNNLPTRNFNEIKKKINQK